jgi:hypothetical protein
MLVPGSANPLLLRTVAAPAAGGISRSLRFNSADSAYLSRTPASAGNRKTWTWAGWVKRASLSTGNDQFLFSGGTTNSNTGFMALYFDSNSKLTLGTATTNILITSSVYRDPSSWMHVLFSFDATAGTNANKAKIYINGTELTAFDTDNRSGVSNQDYGINQSALHEIGRNCFNSARYFDGYFADVFFIDGSALTPSSFTETDATTGQLIPKAYTGSYGTNGFRLTFADNSAATATTLGKDAAGSNNWTPNNLSVTAGAGNDSLVDVPTNGAQTDTGVGGEVRGNYAVLLDQYVTDKTRLTMANGNLDVTFNNSGSSSSALSSIGVSSGKWYSEFTCTQTGSNYAFVGIASPKNNNIDSLGYGDSYAYVSNTGNKANNGSFVSYGATWTANDVIGVALDLDAGTITFYKNGVSQGQAYSSISGTYIIGCTGFLNWKFSANFGQRAFAYTAPSGFKALCTANLPASLVTKPNTVMDVVLWTGTGSSQSISGLGFSPDLVWAKQRSSARHNWLTDTVRGVGKGLKSDTTNSEYTNDVDGYLSAFNADGFTYVAGSSSILNFGQSAGTYVAWTWDAGSSTVTNTQGSITSSVRANATAGFSVFTYTGTGAAGSVGHGLGVAPSLLICKQRNGTADWVVYHSSLGRDKYLILNSTAAQGSITGYWGNSDPTSTVVNFSAGYGGNNGTSNTYVMYAFAPVVGYSSFGSYTGNGSSDGPFVYTGFRPRFILVKNTSVSGAWEIYDSARNTYNVMSLTLLPNTSDAEINAANGVRLDFTSNGFKWRDNGSSINGSGNTIIYAAFAESPFNYARAR